MTERTVLRVFVALALGLGGGCATYTGSGSDIEVAATHRDPGWRVIEGVAGQRQQYDWDCGLAAWTMVLRYWNVEPNPKTIAKTIGLIAQERRPIKAAELRDLAQDHGLLAFLIAGEPADLDQQIVKGRPLIVGLVKPTLGGTNAHYEVVLGIHPAKRLVLTYDPGLGYRQNTFEGFQAEWRASGSVMILMLPSPTAEASASS